MIKNVFALKSIAWLFISISIYMASGCAGVYRIKEKDFRTDGEMIPSDLAEYRNALLFVHLGDKVVQFTAPIFSDGTSTITGEVIELDATALQRYQSAKKNGWPKSLRKAPGTSIEQIHFFVSDYIEHNNQNDTKTISFNKDHVLETHLLKDIAGSGTVGSVLITVGIVAAGIFLFLLIVCNCPHVYAMDGEVSHKLSNAFVGSVSKVLEDSEYIPLPNTEKNTKSVAVVNSIEGELQYINHAEFVRIEHSKDVSILNDQDGNFYSLVKENQRIKPNISELKSKGDFQVLQFNNLNGDDLSEQRMKFVLENHTDAKLILSLKNTNWASFVIEQWYGLFGNKIDNYREKMAQKPREELVQWRKDQGILLDVYTKSGDQWVFQSSIDVVGSTQFKDLVVPLKNVSNSNDTLEVKLVSGYKLWEIDYAAIDYSINEALNISKHTPTSWHLSNDKTEGNGIDKRDESYLVLAYGDTLYLDYTPAPDKKQTVSYAISLTGYYNTEIKQSNKIQRKELYSFKKPAQMSRYSYYLMKELSQSLSVNK